MLSGTNITNVVRNQYTVIRTAIIKVQSLDPEASPLSTTRTLLLVAVGLERLRLFFPCLALVGQLSELQCQIVHPLLLLLLLGVVGVLVLQQR